MWPSPLHRFNKSEKVSQKEITFVPPGLKTIFYSNTYMTCYIHSECNLHEKDFGRKLMACIDHFLCTSCWLILQQNPSETGLLLKERICS